MMLKRFCFAALVALAVVGPASADPGKPAPLIAQSCAGCHGQNGAGQGAVPAILGLSPQDFIATWAAFRANERPATIMNRIARGYTDEEAAALADYFAGLR